MNTSIFSCICTRVPRRGRICTGGKSAGVHVADTHARMGSSA